ncbi:MAG: hypothetical protein ACREEM_44405 [Blastocatellia bacterium]
MGGGPNGEAARRTGFEHGQRGDEQQGAQGDEAHEGELTMLELVATEHS